MGEIWTDHVENFLSFLQGAKNVSPHTLVSYRCDIRQFLDFLHRIHDGVSVDAYTAGRYLASLVAA